MVSAAVLGWGALVLALCVTTFGVWWCATLALCLAVFLAGGLTLVYLLHWEATLKYTADLYRRRSHDARPGLSKVVSASQAAQREPPRLDRRITGAQAVDETLQEVLALALRDYLQPWFLRLSADAEFPREVRRTAQRLAVNFAGRVKEVDWIPYLTTRLVDDAASHLRLFRQARAKAKQQQLQPPTSAAGSEPVSLSSLPGAGGDAASKSGGASPVPPSQQQHGGGHRRTGSSVSLGANTPPQGGSGSHSPQQQPQPLPEPELESLFFDLEVTMEGGDLCRDLVCTDPEYEKQFLRDLSEVVMFLLLPPEDFQCKALRFLLRELLVSSVLLPLLALFSDPDYINQIIVWLVCKEIPLTSEAFLTALRVTDNRDELTATREIVVREIAQLRSRDSGGEDDTWVKQQLSSLQYLRKVVDARLQRLKDGADSDSAGSEGVFFTPTCGGADGNAGAAVPPDSGSPEGLPSQLDWGRLVPAGGVGGLRLFSLPLDVVLKNNVALSYFIDYVTSVGAQAYLFFYLNVEGWRVSAEQQISDLELHKMGAGVTVAGAGASAPSGGVTATATSGGGRKAGEAPQPDSMREAAYSIFEQYLSEKASPRLRLDETVVRKLLFRIRTEAPHETWFDEAQAAVYEKLQTEERFLPGFRASVGYVRLLAELDLLREAGTGGAGAGGGGHGHGDDEEDSAESSLSDNASLASFESDSATVPAAAAALLSNPLVLHDTGSTLSLPGPAPATSGSDCGSVASSVSSAASAAGSQFLAEKRQGPSALTAEIIETGIVNDRGKTYGIYAVSVSRRYEMTGHVDKWHVYRRYSDFHELHSKIKDKYGDLGKLTFPGKKTFHNMERAVLEKRMKMLNDYLQIVMQPGVVGSHPQLRDLLAAFLEQGDYGTSGGGGGGGSGLGVAQVSHALDSLVVNPLKNSMRSVGQAVRTVPDNLLNTVDGVVDGLSRVFGSGGGGAASGGLSLSGSSHTSGSASSLAGAAGAPGLCEATKVGASIDTETADNIPLRIMLLLMDEVFDLKQRNQWLRRRIVTLLRQIIRTMFGDIVNRRILDYVLLMTSPDQVADYLRAFKQALWPNGARAEGRPPRDEATRSRSRVAAKVALLSSLSDELKHIIGSETARRGLLRVFELFQRPVLNRRLLHVLLEGVLRTLFPDNNLEQVFRRLHSQSPRVPRQSSSGGQLKGASKGGAELGLRGEAIAARTR